MIPFTYCFVGPCIKKLSIPRFQPDQGFIPRPIYAFLLFPCHCQSCLVFCFFLDVFECSTKSQSHLFGNWLHSAALISIWNGQQHFALTAFHAASRRFLNFSPLTSIECRGLHQNKTALMKAWRLLLTYPMWQERDVSQQQWTDKFFSFCQKVAYSMFFSGSAACKAYFPLLFLGRHFRVTSLHHCSHLCCAIVISQRDLWRLEDFIRRKIPLVRFFVGRSYPHPQTEQCSFLLWV